MKRVDAPGEQLVPDTAGRSIEELTAELAIDHVLIAVADLDTAVAEFEAQHGVRASGGGRHPDHGTANRIVLLRDCYLELLAVQSPSKLSTSWLAGAAHLGVITGQPLVSWSIRTSDLTALRPILEVRFPGLPDIERGSRVGANGETLSWRIQHLVDEPVPVTQRSALPFVIEWSGARPGSEPAPAHPSGVDRIEKVVIGGRGVTEWVEALRNLLGAPAFLEIDHAAEPGVVGMELGGGSL